MVVFHNYVSLPEGTSWYHPSGFVWSASFWSVISWFGMIRWSWMWSSIHDWLVVDLPLWKMWKSIRMMTFPTEWKIIFMFQKNNRSLVVIPNRIHMVVKWWVYVYMYICIYVYNVYMYICIYVHIHKIQYMRVYIYMYVCVDVYISIYTCISPDTP